MNADAGITTRKDDLAQRKIRRNGGVMHARKILKQLATARQAKEATAS